MRIGLDATYSLGKNLSGVGVYSREMMSGLTRAHPEEKFRFYYRAHRLLKSLAEKLPPNASRRLLSGAPRADLFHALNQRLEGRLNSRSPRTVCTFHDLFVMTGEYSTAEFRERFTAQARDAAARADAVIAVSEFTRSQIVSLLGVPPSRVHVVHHGIRELAAGGAAPGGQNNASRDKVVLNVGTIQKRKNISRLVQAFETLPAPWQLVLAGSRGFGAEEILSRIEQSPARDRIRVTGYVTAEELSGWYARASIFAFPSLDEGFGMPILEAMAAGVPVITSNRSALPEVAGDAALLVDPDDAETLKDALVRLTTNHELCEELARRGIARARCFTWETAVRKTWDVYRMIL